MKRLRRLKLTTALLAAGMLATACDSTPNDKASLETPGPSAAQATALLAPGPDGTPLPPRNSEASRNWPPEFKRFIDEALELFKPGTKEPTLQEFEEKLGIKLLPSDWKKTEDDGRMQVYRVEAPWIYRVKPTDPPFWADLSTLTELPRPFTSSPEAGLRIYRLGFKLDSAISPCINPYDLAIYTGANFTNSDVNPHQLPRPIWPDAYEWGMFKRGYYGRYTSNKRFSISVNAFNSSGPAQHDATCINTFGISASFKPN